MRLARMLKRNLLLCAVLLTVPGMARATLLNALEGTTQSVGPLTFEFTKVEIAGPLDPGQIDLSLVSDSLGYGFNVTPAVPDGIFVSNGAIADIKLEFTVTSTVGIDRGANHLAAGVEGELSSASVSELILEAPAVDLGVFVASFGSLTDNEQSLGAVLATLHVTKNMVVAADDPGGANVAILAQRFRVVPEPTTAGLLMLGVSGLAWAGSRRG